MIFQWLDSNPTFKKVTLVGLTLGLVFSGFYASILGPTQDGIKRLNVEIHRLDQEIQNQKARIITLLNLHAEAQELERAIKKKARFYQWGAQGRSLRQEVNRIALQYELKMVLWKPEDSGQFSGNRFRKMPIQLGIEGGYHQVAQFLEHVLRLPRILKVARIEISRVSPRGEGTLLRSDLTLEGLALSPHDESSQLVRKPDRHSLVRAGS